ncbi:hypothetical protein ACWKWU_18940 [Chitinophaga lutea]
MTTCLSHTVLMLSHPPLWRIALGIACVATASLLIIFIWKRWKHLDDDL